MSDVVKEFKVVIAGAGLVGLLNAVYFARAGHRVEVYEKYPDPRIRRPDCTRSINLTLSYRGEEALREVGLLDEVKRDSITAIGRVARSGDGRVLGRVDYGEKGEGIHSLRRFDLNLFLIDKADEFENVTIYFKHELGACDFDAGSCKFITCNENNQREDKIVFADLFIGADGAHSAMRAEMCKQRKLDLEEFKYHEHGYLEMHIPSKDGEYQLDKNRLHVWPKNSFTLICLPNNDKSFSGTLVMPFPVFNKMLESEESLIAFFQKEFKHVLHLVGEKHLIEQFKPGQETGRRPCKLVSVKCQPYHAFSPSGAKFVLHGDAAHGMVPFYGQGMNTGFEDVQVFNQIFRKNGTTPDGINTTLQEFSCIRCKDGQAMADFSYDHYKALCLNVKKKTYGISRRIDSALHRLFPHTWIPEYTLIAFSGKPQSECREMCKRQEKYISYILFFALMFFIVIVMLVLGMLLFL